MKFLGSVGLGLSVVFTCLLLALVAEIYYLLWWKRRIIRREIEDGYSSNPTKEYWYMFCCKRKSPTLSSSSVNPTSTPQTHQSDQYPDFQFHAQNKNKDYLLQPSDGSCIETQLITGPPRFLFPIKEETREDLESEDGKSREGKRSLSDLLKRIDSPYSTPLSSPLTPMGSCHNSHGYNPFYEASNDAEFNRMIKSSPPPKFKFLRDAEEKLQRKIMLMEEAKKKVANLTKDELNQDGSFTTIVIAKNKENDKPNHHHFRSPHSNPSPCLQVLPLASSPSSLTPSANRELKFSITK